MRGDRRGVGRGATGVSGRGASRGEAGGPCRGVRFGSGRGAGAGKGAPRGRGRDSLGACPGQAPKVRSCRRIADIRRVSRSGIRRPGMSLVQLAARAASLHS